MTVLQAPLVIGADGIESTIANYTGAAYSRSGQHLGAMAYGYWSDLPTDGFEWVYQADACSGFIPTNDDTVFVFASASRRRIGDGGAQVIHDIVDQGAPVLAARLKDATEPLETRVWHGQHGFIRQSHGPGWALVGEAGYFQDPVSVHTLTDALRDAELLGRAVLGSYGDDASVDAALEQYESTARPTERRSIRRRRPHRQSPMGWSRDGEPPVATELSNGQRGRGADRARVGSSHMSEQSEHMAAVRPPGSRTPMGSGGAAPAAS